MRPFGRSLQKVKEKIIEEEFTYSESRNQNQEVKGLATAGYQWGIQTRHYES
ncbi:hypothetical protein PQG02_01875 [Nostoc sp. UHCC 0926]|uniref:hypothetical protein n=1 Tax=unclassified Nostoc TaxID=2593658 RepID=UPI00235E91BC|nr:hypothetical protein [Nostoc sp. UHCC 0926]WDD33183.1 hypothetical protein PQG02_01875 [Nostoc sp. UHCC 0926]